MAYTQGWGISRSQSPFNAFQSPVSYMGTKKKEEIKKEEKEITPEVDISTDEDIITQNNEKADGEIRDASEVLKDQPGYNPTTGKVEYAGTLGAADWLMGGSTIANIASTTVALAPKILPFLKEGGKILSKKFLAKKIDNQ